MAMIVMGLGVGCFIKVGVGWDGLESESAVWNFGVSIGRRTCSRIGRPGWLVSLCLGHVGRVSASSIGRLSARDHAHAVFGNIGNLAHAM